MKGDATSHPGSRYASTRRVDLDALLDPPPSHWAAGSNPPVPAVERTRVIIGEHARQALAKTTFRVVSAPRIDEEDEETLLDPTRRPKTLAGAPALPGYALIGEIARGGMSTVYEGIHRSSGERVAIKHMCPDVAQQPGLVQRFLAEAVAASQLTHPGAVDVYDYGHDAAGVPYLVMEYLEGECLSERLARGPLSTAELVAVTRAIATIAQTAHELGIVHRDLKPDNIFLASGPGPARVMLLDFGVAKFRSHAVYAEITREGQVLGTPHFMSPEQCVGAQVDARSDIYALGCVMYQMLTGRVPFGGDLVTVMAGHLRGTAPSIAALNPEAPAGLIELVEAMMSKDPADRPGSMESVARSIDVAATSPAARHVSPGEVIRLQSASRRAMAQVRDTVSVHPNAPGLPEKRRSRRGLGVLLGLVVAAAASASIWLSLAT